MKRKHEQSVHSDKHHEGRDSAFSEASEGQFVKNQIVCQNSDTLVLIDFFRGARMGEETDLTFCVTTIAANEAEDDDAEEDEAEETEELTDELDADTDREGKRLRLCPFSNTSASDEDCAGVRGDRQLTPVNTTKTPSINTAICVFVKSMNSWK